MFGVKFPKTEITIFTLSRLVEQSSEHVYDKMKIIFLHITLGAEPAPLEQQLLINLNM